MSTGSGPPLDDSNVGDEDLDLETFRQWLQQAAKREGCAPEALLEKLITAYPVLKDLPDLFGPPEPRLLEDVSSDPRPVGDSSTMVGELDTVEFPRGQDRQACEVAIHAARDYLKNEGPASMREIVSNVMPDHPLGYDVPDLEPGDRYRGAWWRRVVRPGLNALSTVRKPPPGGNKWRYTGNK